MNRFDCLSIDCPLFGPHLLEASAGTGKTFAIEHVFVRLILSGIPLEEILAVTFTRAAARELKARIRSNLEKAKNSLQTTLEWAYLSPYMGSSEAIFALANALKGFDRCQIFTIHGFCFRMLKEFAFEAENLFSMEDPDAIEMSKKVRKSLSEFWEKGISPTLLCPEQIARLFGKYDTLQELGTAILRAKKQNSARTFSELEQAFSHLLKQWEISPSNLQKDFAKIRTQYKAHRGDFEPQVESFSNFRTLIQHQGTLFSFLSPSNRKVKQKEVGFLHYPGFFDWAVSHLGPLVFEAADPKKIVLVLACAWEKSCEGIFHPDAILTQMRKAIEIPKFLAVLQQKFKAVIIDEFQDTDALQWDIFSEGFLKNQKLRAFYLVGDPKQSIYRFRSADVYTYFKAKEALSSHIFHLDTNFRSSNELVGSLNELFSRNWLSLPEIKSSIPYHPVRAGSSVTSDFQDEKKALHWMIGEDDAPFLTYAVAEIEKLPKDLKVALIVKDRYEMQKAMDLLQKQKIPCVARSHQTLSETFLFQSLRELFECCASPQDESFRSVVEKGPFSKTNIRGEKTLMGFFSKIGFIEEFQDGYQILEELFAWEQREGFSFEGVLRFFNAFEQLSPEEGSRRRILEVEDAVQVLTLHMSKGLEFDVVFALALASGSPTDEEEEEEINAEKLRQLYVAMTRAKKRLYVPLKKTISSKRPSPMDLFRNQVEKEEGPFIPYLEKLSQSLEEIPSHILLGPPRPLPEIAPDSPCKQAPNYPPSYIYSFTSLAKHKEMELVKTPEEGVDFLPRGKETGTIIHEVFEAIFESPGSPFELIVEKKLRYTPLAPWTPLVQTMVRNTMTQPLSDGIDTFSLQEISEVFVEMEFLYKKENHFIKGFIDLVFLYREKLYIIDWKTNLLKDSSPEAMDEAMKGCDYELQAEIYAQALKHHFGPSFEAMFGGAFYLFVRMGSFVHFMPGNDE